MSKITSFLTFNDQAEEAANFYVSVIPNSRILNVTRQGKSGPGPEGSVMAVAFELDGLPFVALNGGPHFTFTEGFSLSVSCETQDEIDTYWEKLSEGGEKGQCGWLKDRFGLSWQVNPPILSKMLSDPDPAKSKRAMEAMLKMNKIVIEDLQRAYDGR